LNASESAVATAAPPQAGVIGQVVLIFRALRSSSVAKILLWLVLGIVTVILVTAYGQIRLNAWNKNFFDAVSRRDMRGFLLQLGVFFIIAGILLVLNVGQRWLVDTLKWRLREGLVQDLVGKWMEPRRAFWLAHAGAMGVNPDQRMHDDTRNLCDMSTDLGVGLLQASILFGSFAGILFVLSVDFSIRIGDTDYPIPGFMLWAAIIYALAGSVLSYWVGRSLIGRNGASRWCGSTSTSTGSRSPPARPTKGARCRNTSKRCSPPRAGWCSGTPT
jgi:putative ATP-binding cassette transporter